MISGVDHRRPLSRRVRRPRWSGYEATNCQAGVENVLDIMRMGIDSALLGMGVDSVRDLTPEHLVVPADFHRVLGSAAWPRGRGARPASSAHASFMHPIRSLRTATGQQHCRRTRGRASPALRWE